MRQPYDDEIYYEEDEQEARRDRLQLAAGMSNFISVIIGTALILILILLIVSLLNWLRTDIAATFTSMYARF